MAAIIPTRPGSVGGLPISMGGGGVARLAPIMSRIGGLGAAGGGASTKLIERASTKLSPDVLNAASDIGQTLISSAIARTPGTKALSALRPAAVRAAMRADFPKQWLAGLTKSQEKALIQRAITDGRIYYKDMIRLRAQGKL